MAVAAHLAAVTTSLLVAYLGESYLLADRLKRLEQAGLIRRVPYGEHPPRVDYHLTAEGRALGRAVEALADWGLEHFPLTKRIVWPGADRDEAR